MGEALKVNIGARGKLVTWFSTHPVILILSFVFGFVGIIGTAFTIVSFANQNTPKQLTFMASSRQLVSAAESGNHDIVISYKDEVVQDVWFTQIDIAVHGNKGIRSADIAPDKPFSIRVSEPKQILEVLRVENTNPTNQFAAIWNDEKGQIDIDFSFMDVKDRAAIQVLHAGDLEFVPEIYIIETGDEDKAIRQQRYYPDSVEDGGTNWRLLLTALLGSVGLSMASTMLIFNRWNHRLNHRALYLEKHLVRALYIEKHLEKDPGIISKAISMSISFPFNLTSLTMALII